MQEQTQENTTNNNNGIFILAILHILEEYNFKFSTLSLPLFSCLQKIKFQRKKLCFIHAFVFDAFDVEVYVYTNVNETL